MYWCWALYCSLDVWDLCGWKGDVCTGVQVCDATEDEYCSEADFIKNCFSYKSALLIKKSRKWLHGVFPADAPHGSFLPGWLHPVIRHQNESLSMAVYSFRSKSNYRWFAFKEYD